MNGEDCVGGGVDSTVKLLGRDDASKDDQPGLEVVRVATTAENDHRNGERPLMGG